MTSIETVYIPQKAILWEFSSFDDYGQPQVSSPVEIDVEWPEGISESNGNQDSKKSASDEVVVNSVIPLHSILWFGNYIDLPETPTPLYTVVSRRSSPDIKGRAFRRTITVSLFSNTLPTVV